jgi:hypothetical protein
MTETYGAPTAADDIVDTDDVPSARLQRDADALLAEPRPFSASAREMGSIRRALRQDAHDGRLWVSDRAGRVGAVVREEPMKATGYALLAGLFLGLLLRR